MIVRDIARIIRPALRLVADDIGRPEWGSEAAVRLLLGTAAVESGFSAFFQRPNGPALGLWQVEPATWQDAEVNFLAARPELRRAIFRHVAAAPDPVSQLASNIAFGALAARLAYWRAHGRLPEADDVPGQAAMWKRAYNTARGAGTTDKYIAAFGRLVSPHI
ncbi:MAG: hypothetical protein GC150_15445 [Rhizobiales bacterium]|nr:hypothetical protein [Hyphomicrobiales bacterium]